MRTRAKLSPSARHRWGNCPRSVREEEAYSEALSSPSAIDGTHSHTLLERCIKDGLVEPASFLGQTLCDHEDTFVVDAERAERVTVAVQYVRDQSLGGLMKVLSESHVDPAPLLLRDDLHGTVDVQIHGINELEIIDYKDGMHDAWDSALLQMQQYAIGVLAGIPGHAFSHVRMTVIQPKLRLKGQDAIRSVLCEVDHLLGDVARQILVEAGRTDEPDAPLVPGELQCKWCAHKGACSALAAKALAPIEAVDLSMSAARQDPTTMSDEQIVAIMEAAPLMRQLLEAVDAEALRRLRAGTTIAGLKLVNGRGSRAWALPEEEMVAKLKRLGIPKEHIFEKKMISPAKAEKLRWKKTDGTEMQLSERQLATMEKEFVVKVVGAQIVALDSDKRPAIQMDVVELFSPVAETPSWLN